MNTIKILKSIGVALFIIIALWGIVTGMAAIDNMYPMFIPYAFIGITGGVMFTVLVLIIYRHLFQ